MASIWVMHGLSIELSDVFPMVLHFIDGYGKNLVGMDKIPSMDQNISQYTPR